MQCGNCGYHETVHTVMDMPYKFMGRKTIIPNVEGEHCPECGETFLTPGSARLMEEYKDRFDKEITESLGISPQFIRQVRKKLNLGQQEAGSIFGGGVNAFSRYERGKTPPPVSLVKLLRVLDAHPELLPLVQ